MNELPFQGRTKAKAHVLLRPKNPSFLMLGPIYARPPPLLSALYLLHLRYLVVSGTLQTLGLCILIFPSFSFLSLGLVLYIYFTPIFLFVLRLGGLFKFILVPRKIHRKRSGGRIEEREGNRSGGGGRGRGQRGKKKKQINAY